MSFFFFSVVFTAVCLVLYKGDKESSTTSLTTSWFLTIIGTVIAGFLAPFYLIDACRTVASKKPDREKLFGRIDNIPPMPAPTSFPSKDFDGEVFGAKQESKNTRPPLLSTLRKQHTTFIHPPPKPSTKKLTTEDIQAFPLPPTKTKLNLFEKDEIEDHPSPIPAPNSQRGGKNDSDNTSTSISLASTSIEELPGEVENPNGIFKFHKTKTIHKGGKTMLKLQNDKQNLPPVMMVMPGVDEYDNESSDEAPKKRVPKNDLMEQWEQEQARRKFAPYFVDAMKMPLREKSELSPSERLQQKFKKKIDMMNNSEPSETVRKRIDEASTVYTNEEKNKNNKDEKSKKQKKSKKKKKSSKRPISEMSTKTPDVETCVGKYGDDEMSLKSQTGITIYNDISEEEA